MDHFHYRDRVLHCEEVPVRELAAAYGTPLYVYSKATLLHHLGQIQKAFSAVNPLICFSIKTNPNLGISRLMAEHGAGFDVTSGGELYRALLAGGTGDKIVYAGVGKTDDELREGLEKGVFLFNGTCPPKPMSRPIPASRASSSASTSTRCSKLRAAW
jgi:diaminopimelate decarboxylase